MPWEGYNYEDAIILSERLVKDDVLTSIHIEEHEVDARDTKLGAEEITRDIPNLSEEILADLDERGIIRIGAEVGPGDVLVGKVTPKGETEQTPEERLLRAIFGEKAREVRDTSLKVPHGEQGTVIDVRVFSRVGRSRAPARRGAAGPGVRGPEAQDLRGRQARRTPRQQGRHLEDPAHRGHGRFGPTAPRSYRAEPARRAEPDERRPGARVQPGLRGRAGAGTAPATWPAPRSVAPRPSSTRTDPAVWVSTPVFDGAHWDEEDQAGRHPTIQQIFRKLNPDGEDGTIQVNDAGKSQLYNGRTGEAYDNPISVGYVYILKLHHLVDDKIHARSTGPSLMITQQPLGGKAQFGGQRFGEMEVWALEAFGAAYALQELLTIKSDDVLGRVKVYEAIVKGENIPEPGIPESFKVLIKEMQSLCLDVEVLAPGGEEIEMRELDEDVFRTAGARHRHQPTRAWVGRGRCRRAAGKGDSDVGCQRVRPAADRAGHGRLHPRVVQRRGQEAGDHQLPHAAPPRRTGSSARRSSDPPRTGSATAASTSARTLRGIICERCGVEVTRSKVRRERMGHIELAAPVVHIWYLRGTRSWLAYLLMGTEAHEELKAKQLEKVIYFAANLVTWVDEAKRHEDLPELEAELRDEIAKIEKDRDLDIDRRYKELEKELSDLEKAGAKDAETKARQRLADKEIAGVHERYDDEITLAQRAFDEFKSLHSRKILEDELLWHEMRIRYEDYFEGGMGAETIRTFSSTGSTSTPRRSSSAR